MIKSMAIDMEDNSYLLDYYDDVAFSLDSGKLFKVAKFRETMNSAFIDPERVPYYLTNLLNQKGKVRIKVTLEFCPDKPEVEETTANKEIAQTESPLDALRQMINQETQL